MNTEPHEPPPQVAITEPAVDGAATPAPHEEAAAPAEAPAATAPGVSPAECGARLAALFPALFTAPGAPGPVKPIKLRIHADIQARAPGEFSKRVLGIFFSRYTTTNAYLKALAAPGAQRFDLDGAAVGEIAAEHRNAAVEEVARRQAIAAERRAAQQPRRAPPPPREAPAAPSATADGPALLPRRDGRPESRRSPGPPGRRGERPEPRDRRPSNNASPSARGRPLPRHPPSRDEVARPPTPAQQQAPAASPADPVQRERLMLLRSFEASPLSKANFCALKRISEAELDAALILARTERA